MAGLEAEVRGTLVGQDHRWTSGCGYLVHGEGASPDAIYPFTVSERADFTAELTPELSGAVLALAAADEEITCAVSPARGAPVTIRRTLAPGEYQLIVEARGTASDPTPEAGPFTIRHHAEPLASRERLCAAASELSPGELTAEIVAGPSQLELGPGPEHVYALTTQAEQHVRLQVPSGFEVSILRGCDERAVVRQAAERLEHVLPPGAYYVVVEGTGPYTLSLAMQLPGPAAVCASAPVLPLGYDGLERFTLDTLGADSNTALSCGPGGRTADATRRVRVDRPTELRIRASAAAHGSMFSVRTSCGNGAQPGAELFCSRAAGGEHPLVVQRALLVPGTDYFVTVEGAAPSEVGETQLDAELRDLSELARICPRAPRVGLGASRTVEDMPAAASLSPRFGMETRGAIYRLELTQRQRVRARLEATGDGVMGLEVRRDCLDPRSLVGADGGYAREHAVEADLPPGTYFIHTWMTAGEQRPPGEVTLRVEPAATE